MPELPVQLYCIQNRVAAALLLSLVEGGRWLSYITPQTKWFVNRKVVCCAQSFDNPITTIPWPAIKILPFQKVYIAIPEGVPFQGSQAPCPLAWEFSCLDVAASFSSSSASSSFSQLSGLHWICSALFAQAKQNTSLQEPNWYPSAFCNALNTHFHLYKTNTLKTETMSSVWFDTG